MSSKYLRPGVLDGVVGYAYNPATLPNGAQTYATSTGQMKVVYDGNFSQGEVGHDASYMRIVEAYQIKKQIDQQAFNSLAIYQTAGTALSTDPTLQNGAPLAGDDSSLLPDSTSTTSTSGPRAAARRRSSIPTPRPTTRSMPPPTSAPMRPPTAST